MISLEILKRIKSFTRRKSIFPIRSIFVWNYFFFYSHNNKIEITQDLFDSFKKNNTLFMFVSKWNTKNYKTFETEKDGILSIIFCAIYVLVYVLETEKVKKNSDFEFVFFQILLNNGLIRSFQEKAQRNEIYKFRELLVLKQLKKISRKEYVKKVPDNLIPNHFPKLDLKICHLRNFFNVLSCFINFNENIFELDTSLKNFGVVKSLHLGMFLNFESKKTIIFRKISSFKKKKNRKIFHLKKNLLGYYLPRIWIFLLTKWTIYNQILSYNYCKNYIFFLISKEFAYHIDFLMVFYFLYFNKHLEIIPTSKIFRNMIQTIKEILNSRYSNIEKKKIDENYYANFPFLLGMAEKIETISINKQISSSPTMNENFGNMINSVAAKIYLALIGFFTTIIGFIISGNSLIDFPDYNILSKPANIFFNFYTRKGIKMINTPNAQEKILENFLLIMSNLKLVFGYNNLKKNLNDYCSKKANTETYLYNQIVKEELLGILGPLKYKFIGTFIKKRIFGLINSIDLAIKLRHVNHSSFLLNLIKSIFGHCFRKTPSFKWSKGVRKIILFQLAENCINYTQNNQIIEFLIIFILEFQTQFNRNSTNDNQQKISGSVNLAILKIMGKISRLLSEKQFKKKEFQEKDLEISPLNNIFSLERITKKIQVIIPQEEIWKKKTTNKLEKFILLLTNQLSFGKIMTNHPNKKEIYIEINSFNYLRRQAIGMNNTIIKPDNNKNGCFGSQILLFFDDKIKEKLKPSEKNARKRQEMLKYFVSIDRNLMPLNHKFPSKFPTLNYFLSQKK